MLEPCRLSPDEYQAIRNETIEKYATRQDQKERGRVEEESDHFQTYCVEQLGRSPYERFEHLDLKADIDRLKDSAQKRVECHRHKSLADEVTNDGVPLIEVLPNPQPSSADEPSFLGKSLSEAQREKIRKVVGDLGLGNPKTAARIIKYFVRCGVSFEKKGRKIKRVHGEKKEDAKALGISERTLGRYVGNSGKEGILAHAREQLEEILRWM